MDYFEEPRPDGVYDCVITGIPYFSNGEEYFFITVTYGTTDGFLKIGPAALDKKLSEFALDYRDQLLDLEARVEVIGEQVTNIFPRRVHK